ncbi:MAG TPA: DUF6230 family protein [Ktedonobacteraceae bacterium]
MDSTDTTLPNPVPDDDDDLYTSSLLIGKTDTRIFWGVMLVASLVLAFLVHEISSGAVALAMNAPVSFTMSGTELDGTNFKLYPALSSADNSTPVAVNQMDGTVKNMVISKQITLPVAGTFTIKMAAGSGNTPVSMSGLKADVGAFQSGNFTATNLSLNTAGTNGFEQDADSVVITNPDITLPFMSMNSTTLPGLTVTITR